MNDTEQKIVIQFLKELEEFHSNFIQNTPLSGARPIIMNHCYKEARAFFEFMENSSIIVASFFENKEFA